MKKMRQNVDKEHVESFDKYKDTRFLRLNGLFSEHVDRKYGVASDSFVMMDMPHQKKLIQKQFKTIELGQEPSTCNTTSVLTSSALGFENTQQTRARHGRGNSHHVSPFTRCHKDKCPASKVPMVLSPN